MRKERGEKAPSRPCDNSERFCLDVIALAELLAPGDVTSVS